MEGLAVVSDDYKVMGSSFKMFSTATEKMLLPRLSLVLGKARGTCTVNCLSFLQVTQMRVTSPCRRVTA